METTNDNHLDNIIDDSYNPYEYELHDLSNNEYIQKLDKITSMLATEIILLKRARLKQVLA